MPRLNLVFFLIVCICLSQGCSYKGRDAILKTQYDSDTVKTVFAINHKSDHEEYYNVIRPEDELSIRNLQNKSLIVGLRLDDLTQPQTNTVYKVDGDGNIFLPILGKMRIAGLNRMQAAAKIQMAYQAQELKDPIIDVQIVNMYVTVLGEVNKQGKFLISREDLQLIDLLGEVGGLTTDANKKSIKIIRGDRSDPEVILVNLDKYDFLKDKNLRLKSGDVVYVEPKRGLNFHNLKGYAGFVQLGILAINCLLIIYNR
jgi:polysaccharide export outer membrane protein